VGFGDVPFLGDMSPALTTVRINGEKIGEIGAQYLVNKAQGLPNSQPVLDVGFSIIERDTT
jgi:LacI family gluconate utilization system Gnt-I transcriptional repressor